MSNATKKITKQNKERKKPDGKSLTRLFLCPSSCLFLVAETKHTLYALGHFFLVFDHNFDHNSNATASRCRGYVKPLRTKTGLPRAYPLPPAVSPWRINRLVSLEITPHQAEGEKTASQLLTNLLKAFYITA